MIVDLDKMDAPTPKGCHVFLDKSCHPFGIMYDGYLHHFIIVSSLWDWNLRKTRK